MTFQRSMLALMLAVFGSFGATAARAQPDGTPNEPTAPAAPLAIEATPGAAVIVDDHLKDATADEAAQQLGGCAVIPGCTAIWRAGVGAIVTLGPVEADPQEEWVSPPGDY